MEKEELKELLQSMLIVLKKVKNVMDADHYNAIHFDSLYDDVNNVINLAEGGENV